MSVSEVRVKDFYSNRPLRHGYVSQLKTPFVSWAHNRHA